MTKKELAQSIYKVSHLTGEFKLRSGLTSSEYFDKYRFEALPQLLREIATHLVPMVPRDSEILAGLEMGWDPHCDSFVHGDGNSCSLYTQRSQDLWNMPVG